jgi:uncharacterized membrane protein (DUF106 family)
MVGALRRGELMDKMDKTEELVKRSGELVRGYKLLDDDSSLNDNHGRVRYPVGERIMVPGNGAYVVVTGGLLVGGGDVSRNTLAVFECEEPTGAEAPAGVVCFRWVRRLVLDQELLVWIAEHAAACDVRQAAVARVTDQELLARVAEHDAAWMVRQAAVARVTDQELLARVAEHAAACDVRQAAVARVTDQELLARVAEHDAAWMVRQAAVARVTDQELLARVAEHAAACDVRQAAVARVTAQELLARVAEHDAAWMVRQAAVARVTELKNRR